MLDRSVAKPLLLIDVDGVLNPYGRDGAKDAEFETHILAGQAVRLNRRHGEWLHRLTIDYDLVWATTWEEDANRLIAPIIGAPSGLPVIAFHEHDSLGWAWKLPAVRQFVGNRPAAWLDDDPGEGAEEWARQRAFPTRLLRPDGRIGWSRGEYQQLLELAEEIG